MLPFHRRSWLQACASVAFSWCLHGALLAVAVGLWLMGLWMFDASAPSMPMLTVTPVQLRVEHVQLESAFEHAAESDSTHNIDGDELLAGLSDPRWQQLVEPVSVDEAEHAGTFVSIELDRITEAAKQRSVEENLSRLDELSQRISSTKAVDDINNQLGKVLKIEERADRPAEAPIEGEFEVVTAQLHDVQKRVDDQGNVTYWAVLVDAAGRKLESPMGTSEGETAFRTMNLIKSNPLLERVYRGVVMSMMDQVLKNTK